MTANNQVIAIMQSYFFPYLGYFSLINSCTHWYIFDVCQYTPKTWMNRNRILHPSKEWQYLTVSLSNSSRSIRSSDAIVASPQETLDSFVRKLSLYKNKAPYYDNVISLLMRCFEDLPDSKLITLNTKCLVETCKYLGIEFQYTFVSDLDIPFPPGMGPGDWAPFISRYVNANSYVNPSSGSHLFSLEVFKECNVDLYYHFYSPIVYRPSRPFLATENLSVLDVMMWVDPADIVGHINSASINFPG